jgi:hypothetical protein
MITKYTPSELLSILEYSAKALGASDEEIYEFTRCVRPDGSVYGSRGKCRKGAEQSKESTPSKKTGKEEAKLERAISKQKAHVKRLSSGQVQGTPEDLKRARAALKAMEAKRGEKSDSWSPPVGKKSPPENPTAEQIRKMSDDDLWNGKASYKPGTAGHSAYKNEIDRRRDLKERVAKRTQTAEPSREQRLKEADAKWEAERKKTWDMMKGWNKEQVLSFINQNRKISGSSLKDSLRDLKGAAMNSVHGDYSPSDRAKMQEERVAWAKKKREAAQG